MNKTDMTLALMEFTVSWAQIQLVINNMKEKTEPSAENTENLI